MSVQAIVWVIERSKARLGDRLVLLSIANHADPAGLNAWPSVSTIAKEAGLSKRAVQKAIPRLMASGELQGERSAGMNGTWLFAIPPVRAMFGGEKSAPPTPRKVFAGGAKSTPQGGENFSPEPSVKQPSLEPSKAKPCGPEPPAAPPPETPPDTRRSECIEFAHRTFQEKHGQKPTWAARDYRALGDLLTNKHITSFEFQRRWTNYLRSTELFTVKQGDSLTYFCARFDTFLEGPIKGTGVNGNGTGKASDLFQRNLEISRKHLR